MPCLRFPGGIGRRATVLLHSFATLGETSRRKFFASIVVNALSCLYGAARPAQPGAPIAASPGQRMLQKAIIATVDLCIRYAVQVIGIAVVSTVIAGVYAADH